MQCAVISAYGEIEANDKKIADQGLETDHWHTHMRLRFPGHTQYASWTSAIG